MEEIKKTLQDHLKFCYNIYKRDFDEINSVPYELRGKIYHINKKVLKSKLFIFAGLYNKNKTHYDKGIADFLEISTEQLDTPAPFYTVELNEDTGEEIETEEVDNEEAVRQLGNYIKDEYEEYKKFGKFVFG